MKLNIGCRDRVMKDWVNIDIAGSKHDLIAYAHDIPLPNNSCSIIYASHVLEYYDWQEASEKVLPEWYRLLKPGGIVRIAVPDFEAITRLYMAGFNLNFFIGPMFGRIKVNDKWIYHKAIYDKDKLTELLAESGFRDVRLYRWQETEHAAYDDQSMSYIPHMDKKNGVLISLNVEATK